MKDDFRPDPDELLLKSAEENAAKKGRLKIFSAMPPELVRPTPCWKQRIRQ